MAGAAPKRPGRRPETCVVFASGPSLSETQVTYVRRAHEAGRCWALAVNDTWLLAPWADVLYACDLRWWQKRAPKAEQYLGLRYTQDERAAGRYGLELVGSRSGAGLCLQPWVVNQGLNSGYQALNLAYHFGARRVLLLGFDMQITEGKSHFFGDYPRETGLQVPSPYSDFVDRFGPLADDLAAQGVEVINCSPSTALECFKRGSVFKELELK